MTAPSTAPTVNRARRFRYHSAVHAARMLNAIADAGSREHASRTDRLSPPALVGRGRTGTTPRGAVTSS